MKRIIITLLLLSSPAAATDAATEVSMCKAAEIAAASGEFTQLSEEQLGRRACALGELASRNNHASCKNAFLAITVLYKIAAERRAGTGKMEQAAVHCELQPGSPGFKLEVDIDRR